MIRYYALLLMLLLPFSSISAQERTKIGVVLSGGGAKGAAHVAVLKVLEQNRIPVDYIAGTSIGSYVAGMYALGYSASEIEQIMLTQNWDAGYSDTIPREELSYRNKEYRDRYNLPINLGYSDDKVRLPNGLLRGQTMSQLLQHSTGLVHKFDHFDQLAIPYRAVATDLETSRAVVLSSGSVVKAMQASSTVPGALQPAELNGYLLVDGGISNNMPVDVVQQMGAEVIIAVDIGSPLVQRDELTSTISVLNQLSTILTAATTEKQKELLSEQDILIRPAVDDLSTTDFSIMPKAFEVGEIAANQQLDKLRLFSVSESEFQQYLQVKKKRSQVWIDELAYPTVDIVINNESGVDDQLIYETLELEDGTVITQEQLEEALAKVYAMDNFERVYGEFTDTDEGRILTVTTRAKSWGPNYFRFGFGWEDDFTLDSSLTLDFAYTMTDLTRYGGEWHNSIRIGFEKFITTEFYLPLDYSQLFFTRAQLSYDIKDRYIFNEISPNFKLEQKQYSAELGIGSNLFNFSRVELGLIAEDGDFGHEALAHDLHYRTYGGYLKLAFDNLNSIHFPTQGNRLTINTFYRHEEQSYQDIVNPFFPTLYIELDWKGAINFGNHAVVGITSLATIDTDAKTSIHVSELGGFLNLSGYHKHSLMGPHKVFGALVYQYDLGRDALGMTDYPLYLGTSLEAGNVWQAQQDIAMNDLIYSGSLYVGTDTGLGPVAFGFGWADDGAQTVFLFVGKNW